MNAFNRVILVLLVVLTIVAVMLVMVAPQRSFEVASGFFAYLADNSAALMEDPTDWPLFATARVVGGGVLLLACLVVLWLEFRKPRRRTIRATKTTGGESFIATESICQRLAYNVDQLPDVVGVTPRVTGFGRGGLNLELVLETAPEIDVPSKTEEVLQVVREVVTDRMGLKLGKVQVKIKHAPYPRQ